jgi:FkbM family methyltransferase
MKKVLKVLIRYYSVLGIAGVFRAVMGKFSKRPVLMQVPEQATPHPIYLRVPSSDIEVFYQVFRSEEYKFEANQSPDFIVDAGANIGLTSVYFARRFPDARILAIEPEASNFELLKKNVEGYPNVITFHGALWGKDAEVEVIDPGFGNWSFITGERGADNVASTTQRQTVRGITINKIIQEYGLREISILKLDIEGAELEVFRSSASWIDRIDSLIAELHERINPGCNRAFYRATDNFDTEWHQGELVYLTRTGGFLRNAYRS